MKIRVFTSEEENNAFTDTVTPHSITYESPHYILMYTETPSVNEMREKKIRTDEAEALVGMEEAKMQLQYLKAIAELSEEDAKRVEGSIKGQEQNISNYKIKLDTIKLWKSE